MDAHNRDEDYEVRVLAHPVAERVRETGLEIAGLLIRRLEGKRFSPLVIDPVNAQNYYHMVAISQTAVMEVVRFETSQEWNPLNLQASINAHWGEHPSPRINRKVQKGTGWGIQRLPHTQSSILLKGLGDLMSKRILRFSYGELEIDPLADDFDPRSGKGVEIIQGDIPY